jgi:hypothetical protein
MRASRRWAGEFRAANANPERDILAQIAKVAKAPGYSRPDY